MPKRKASESPTNSKRRRSFLDIVDENPAPQHHIKEYNKEFPPLHSAKSDHEKSSDLEKDVNSKQNLINNSSKGNESNLNNFTDKNIEQENENQQHLQNSPSELAEKTSDTKLQIIRRLAGRIPPPIHGLDLHFLEIYGMLERSVTMGEGNSCLLVGPRSTGKTLLVNAAIEKLEKNYNGQFIAIRLSGFEQTDERMVFREICRQIDRVLARDGSEDYYEKLERSSIAECFQALLDIMDPPYAGSDEEDNGDESSRASSVAVVIVLDEFDRFAVSSRQTVMYNLFDLAQSSKTPVAFLCVSSTASSRDQFEKRVRSRYSQRILTFTHAHNQDQFWAIARSIITDPGMPMEWETALDSLYKNQNSNLYRLVQEIYWTSKDMRELCDRLIGPVSRSPPSGLVDRLITLPPDSAPGFLALRDLSDLELSLLICGARVEVQMACDALNFNIVYTEYEKMSKESMKGFKVWSRDVARTAWEWLEDKRLIVPMDLKAYVRGSDALMKLELNLIDLGNGVPSEHVLKKWTRL